MLLKVKMLNYERGSVCAPPQVEVVINTDHIVSAEPAEARGSGPFLRVHFTNGKSMTIVGEPGMLARASGKWQGASSSEQQE